MRFRCDFHARFLTFKSKMLRDHRVLQVKIRYHKFSSNMDFVNYHKSILMSIWTLPRTWILRDFDLLLRRCSFIYKCVAYVFPKQAHPKRIPVGDMLHLVLDIFWVAYILWLEEHLPRQPVITLGFSQYIKYVLVLFVVVKHNIRDKLKSELKHCTEILKFKIQRIRESLTEYEKNE